MVIYIEHHMYCYFLPVFHPVIYLYLDLLLRSSCPTLFHFVRKGLAGKLEFMAVFWVLTLRIKTYSNNSVHVHMPCFMFLYHNFLLLFVHLTIVHLFKMFVVALFV